MTIATATATAIATGRKLLTADDLYRLPDDGYRHELVKGKLITMPPPNYRHTLVTGNLGGHIWYFIRSNNLGFTGGPEGAAYIAQNPDTVRAADYAVYPIPRFPEPLPDGPYIPGLIPELVVETIGPSYGVRRAAARARMWQDTGVRLVVMAYIADRAIETHAADGTVRRFAAGDTLTLEPVLPGFAVPVADIFGF